MSFESKKYVDDIRNLRDLSSVIEYYYPNKLKDKKMVCPFHDDKNPSFYIKESNYGNAFYKCFGCNESGDIISFIQKVDHLSFIQALKKAYDILGKPINLKNKVEANKDKKTEDNNISIYSKPYLTTNNKQATISYYDKKIKEAKIKGKDNLAANYESIKYKEFAINYEIDFPYLDNENKVLKIWENLECILIANKIEVYYNEITKTIGIEGLPSTNLNECMTDIYSLCNKYGFKIGMRLITEFITKIGMDKPRNPVREYLEDCERLYPKASDCVDKLCECIITKKNYNQNLKHILVKKWLMNTARIVYNMDGNMNVEGVLTLQGAQGIGKTRLIKKIIPMYVKTGLDLDPSDKDKINQCIKYWVCELGELDSTLKKDVAKLKAFLTEQEDEYRRPYAIFPVKYPRMTSFYATVNHGDFLKDETGNRRYWVIPVEKIDFEKLQEIDINKLWAEVMKLLCDKKEKCYLTNDEMNMLNESNDGFVPMNNVRIMVESGFNWESPKEEWCFVTSSEIARCFGLKSTKGLKSAMEFYGGVFKKKSGTRGYICPKLIRIW